MDFFQILLVAVVLLAIWFWISNKRPKGFPKGPLGLPIVGYLPFFGALPFKTCIQLGKKYGNVFSVKFGNCFVVVLNDWSAIKEALVTQEDTFDGRPPNIIFETLYNYDNIGAVDGKTFKERRNFTMQYLKSMGFGKSSFERVIMEEMTVLFQKLQGHSNQVVKVENYFYFFDSLFNIMWSLIGGKVQCDDTVRQEVTHMVRNSFEALTSTGPFFFLPSLRHVRRREFQSIVTNTNNFNKFLSNVLQQHIDTYQDGHVVDFMDAGLAHMFRQEKNLAKDSIPFTKDNVMQIAKDLFLAGTDTTANTLTWALLYMALWPTFQEKVQQEMDDVIGRQRLPSFNDRTLLPYACCVLLEIQRYSSIVPFALLHSAMRDTKLFGYILPKGSVVAPNLWAVHHDPVLWGDPQVFRPERFLNKDGQVEKPEYLLPFSVGGRICPGKSFAEMSMFLFFTCLLHQFKFSLKPGEELPSLEPVHTLTLLPRPFALLVKQRTDSFLL